MIKIAVVLLLNVMVELSSSMPHNHNDGGKLAAEAPTEVKACKNLYERCTTREECCGRLGCFPLYSGYNETVCRGAPPIPQCTARYEKCVPGAIDPCCEGNECMDCKVEDVICDSKRSRKDYWCKRSQNVRWQCPRMCNVCEHRCIKKDVKKIWKIWRHMKAFY